MKFHEFGKNKFIINVRGKVFTAELNSWTTGNSTLVVFTELYGIKTEIDAFVWRTALSTDVKAELEKAKKICLEFVKAYQGVD